MVEQINRLKEENEALHQQLQGSTGDPEEDKLSTGGQQNEDITTEPRETSAQTLSSKKSRRFLRKRPEKRNAEMNQADPEPSQLQQDIEKATMIEKITLYEDLLQELQNDKAQYEEEVGISLIDAKYS